MHSSFEEARMGDTLHGLAAIAATLGIDYHQAWYLAKRKAIPVYKVGSTVCSTRKLLFDWQAANVARAEADYAAHRAAAD